MEDRVAAIATEMLNDQSGITEKLMAAGMSIQHLPQALKTACNAAQQFVRNLDKETAFDTWVQRVDLRPDGITVTLTLAPLTQSLGAINEMTITRSTTVIIKRRGVEMRLVIEDEKSIPTRIDPTLIKTIARAHCWFDDLATGKVKSINEIAARESVGKSYVGDIMKLAFLPPALVEQIVEGRQPATLVTDHLVKNQAIALDWAQH